MFDAGPLWPRMIIADETVDQHAATVADDQHIVVTVDSDTGEVRECGDMSGRCVAMNPWTHAVATSQHAPVMLQAHAAEIERETGAVAQHEAEQRR